MGEPSRLVKMQYWIRNWLALLALKIITIPALYWANPAQWEEFLEDEEG